jgi:hypothetical protein
MRTAMRPRYYCDHCNKGNGSPSAMKRHERGCTANPNRVCGMCARAEDEEGVTPAPPRDELLRILDADGFKAMCDVANQCPACILSALRARNVEAEFSNFRVSGPEDGRNEWSYATAKANWWESMNSIVAERETHS